MFWRYAIRNALLPQLTALALALGNIVSGAVLVEVIFQYPGVGSLLYQSIRASDFYMIQGVVFMIIVAIGLATLILDLVYPLLDPRISYARKVGQPWPLSRSRKCSRAGKRAPALWRDRQRHLALYAPGVAGDASKVAGAPLPAWEGLRLGNSGHGSYLLA